ncbi:hypothetical protein EQH57_0340 [Dictyocoela roeselum]|nr:hypothetical protein EQH57_0340 [Dictyocoela roeselum]
MPSGDIIKCLTSVTVKFYLNNDRNCRYRSKFYLLETRNKNAILGMQFLKENDAIIDLKNNFINLDDKEYELNHDNSNLDKYEQEIASMSTIFTLRAGNSSFKDLKNEIKIRNPKIGHIANVEHEIEPTSDFTPRLKNIPYHYQ